MEIRRKKLNRKPSFPAVYPVDAPIDVGLTAQQVQERMDNGLQNRTPSPNTKSVGQIIRENSLTFFNLIFVILAVALAIAGSSVKNMTFLMVAFFNTVIGIFHEIRAKRAVDKLTLVSAGSLKTLRDGKLISLRSDLLVRDDIVEFSSGDQICADAIVRSGQLYVNEALLTGEPDAVVKNPGDPLRSGSFVISGHGRSQLTAVGAESYAAKLTTEARRDTKSTKSEMMKALSRLISIVGIALIPMGIILFIRQLYSEDITASVEHTVAALIGMIPEGLYLLTSMAIAVSSLKLAKKRVLLQDMNCIETLAHVDILCVDKTGTITESYMEVADLYPLCTEEYSHEQIENILAGLYHGKHAENETAKALITQFSRPTDWVLLEEISFSSERKWSGADFGEKGTYVIGAPEFILKKRYEEIRPVADAWSERGCRVLLLAAYHGKLTQKLDTSLLKSVALIFLRNRIRPDAVETFRYFAKQGVSIRVISGDHPITVSQVATEAGIENAEKYVDAGCLVLQQDFLEAVEKYTVFGRVTPEQKRRLIQAFRAKGHTVAMTGDGVNDVLALKEADCGVAMASGAQAASQISQIVLMDSQFSAMPSIVAEGRRVINNIQRAASLFLVKNIFSFGLTLLLLFIKLPYPLQPIQLSLISTLCIGIPSFFLALEPNYAIVKGTFMRNVIRRAMPGGLTNIVLILLAALFVTVFDLPIEQLNTISVCVMASVGLLTLYHVSKPFTKLRLVVLIGMTAAMVVCILVMPGFFELSGINFKSGLIIALLLLACPMVLRLFLVIFDHRVAKHDAKSQK